MACFPFQYIRALSQLGLLIKSLHSLVDNFLASQTATSTEDKIVALAELEDDHPSPLLHLRQGPSPFLVLPDSHNFSDFSLRTSFDFLGFMKSDCLGFMRLFIYLIFPKYLQFGFCIFRDSVLFCCKIMLIFRVIFSVKYETRLHKASRIVNGDNLAISHF